MIAKPKRKNQQRLATATKQKCYLLILYEIHKSIFSGKKKD